MTVLDTQPSGPYRAREAQHPFAARNVLPRQAYSTQMDLLGQMTVFVRVVESRSLTAAARQLRVSAATVSRQLLALEQTLSAADPTHDATFHRHRCGEAVLRAVPPRGPRDR